MAPLFLKFLKRRVIEPNYFINFSCDINAAMLEVGKKRASGIGFTSADLSWQEGDAQALPFEDNTFDAYTISFGIRNVVDVQKVILVVCILFY